MKIKINGEEFNEVVQAAKSYRDEALFMLMEDKIIIRLYEPSDTAMYASMIPEDAMDVYERGEHPQIGLNLETLDDFTPDKDTELLMYIEDGKLHTVYDDMEYVMGMLHPDSVAGVPDPDSVPQVDPSVKIENDIDWIVDFAKEASRKILSDDNTTLYLAAVEGTMNLWVVEDDNQMALRKHWEDFDDYDIDWKGANTRSPAESFTIDEHPEDTRRMDALFSTTFIKNITIPDGESRVEFDNYFVIKFVTESENGVKHSWIIPPLLPTASKYDKIPESIIKERGV